MRPSMKQDQIDRIEVMLKMSLRNDHTIMKALMNIGSNTGGVGHMYMVEALRDRVRSMESNYEWVCLPSQKIS